MEKFGLGKKWFWIGIVCGFHIGFGLIYGIALAFEKKFRKEVMIIITWTIVWFVFQSQFLVPFLQTRGLYPVPVFESQMSQEIEALKLGGTILPTSTLPQ